MDAGPSSVPAVSPDSESITSKFNKAKDLKAAGDEAFKAQNWQGTLLKYHEALLYLKGLDKNATQKALGAPVPPPPPVDAAASQDEKVLTEVDLLLEKIYSNMAQVHLNNGRWKRAIETADKALSHNKKNIKAMFRKAKALKEQGYFEKAEEVLKKIQEEGDDDEKEAAVKEMESVKAAEKATTAKHNQKMKGFLNKEKVDLTPN
ncbi:TPR-like protein [Epithele typhae]|uniref:TPR-like protein n=1 Tax=Epithele typhae TaxID=378194 RepID=UPI0020072755|nr:TPR-like protein [Epithele typhae]KAH9945138.1 TPR-like protein [Epithele typhae]